MTHIIIPRISPIKSFGMKLFVIALLGSLIFAAFELGRSSLLDKYLPETEEKVIVVKEIVQNEVSENAILLLEKKYQIELEACKIIKQTLAADKQKIMDLEKDLAFYKAIMEPAKDKESIYLQSLEIVPFVKNKKDKTQALEKNKKRYRYRFIVAQKVKKRSQTKGTISLNIRGKQDDKSVNFSISSLLIENPKKQKIFSFSFKYFIEYKGIIDLPDDFQAQAVDSIIKVKNKKSSIILNDLLWTDQKGLKYVGE